MVVDGINPTLNNLSILIMMNYLKYLVIISMNEFIQKKEEDISYQLLN